MVHIRDNRGECKFIKQSSSAVIINNDDLFHCKNYLNLYQWECKFKLVSVDNAAIE